MTTKITAPITILTTTISGSLSSALKGDQGEKGDAGGDVTEQYKQNGTLAVGDLVFLSAVSENYVEKTVDNNSVNAIIGIVSSIISTKEVDVTHLGFFDITGVLESGKRVYIGIDGSLTDVVPVGGYIQQIGIMIANSRIFLNPVLTRTLRDGQDEIIP